MLTDAPALAGLPEDNPLGDDSVNKDSRDSQRAARRKPETEEVSRSLHRRAPRPARVFSPDRSGRALRLDCARASRAARVVCMEASKPQISRAGDSPAARLMKGAEQRNASKLQKTFKTQGLKNACAVAACASVIRRSYERRKCLSREACAETLILLGPCRGRRRNGADFTVGRLDIRSFGVASRPDAGADRVTVSSR